MSLSVRKRLAIYGYSAYQYQFYVAQNARSVSISGDTNRKNDLIWRTFMSIDTTVLYKKHR